jgi:hypothetical protein
VEKQANGKVCVFALERTNVMISLSLRFARSILAVSITLITLLSTSTVYAKNGSAITFTSGTYQASGLANDGSVGTDYDRVNFTSQTDTLTLTADTPVSGTINDVVFVVGPSSSEVYGPISYSGSETFTADGMTKTLGFTYTVSSLYDGDELHILPGQATSFDLGSLGVLDVTPQDLFMKTGSNETGLFTAMFELHEPNGPGTSSFGTVPEPSSGVTFLVGGLIIFCSLLVVRKRRAV